MPEPRYQSDADCLLSCICAGLVGGAAFCVLVIAMNAIT